MTAIVFRTHGVRVRISLDRGPFYGLNQVQLVMAPWVVVNALTPVSAANHCKYVLCEAVVALE